MDVLNGIIHVHELEIFRYVNRVLKLWIMIIGRLKDV